MLAPAYMAKWAKPASTFSYSFVVEVFFGGAGCRTSIGVVEESIDGVPFVLFRIVHDYDITFLTIAQEHDCAVASMRDSTPPTESNIRSPATPPNCIKDSGKFTMIEPKPEPFDRPEAVRILWEIASQSPERSRGSLATQISACRLLYKLFRHDPVLRRLGELAAIERSRTKGSVKGQDAAAKLLDRLLKSIKPDKNRGIQ